MSAIAMARLSVATDRPPRFNAANQDTIMAMGGVPPLIGLLPGASGPEVQAQCAFALMEITRDNPEIQTLIYDLGGVAPLTV